MDLGFDWDDANSSHLALHDITPDEAEQVMHSEPYELEIEDHPEDILRIRYIGETRAGRVLIVLITWRGDLIRVISGSDAPRNSKASYLKRKALDDGSET